MAMPTARRCWARPCRRTTQPDHARGGPHRAQGPHAAHPHRRLAPAQRHHRSRRLMGAMCLYTDMTELREKEASIMAQNQIVTDAAKRAEEVVLALLDCSKRLTGQIAKAEDGAALQRERAGATSQAMGDMSESIQGRGRKRRGGRQGRGERRAQGRGRRGRGRQVVSSVGGGSRPGPDPEGEHGQPGPPGRGHRPDHERHFRHRRPDQPCWL